MSRTLPFPRGRGAMVWAAGAFVLIYAALMAASYLDPAFAGDEVPRNVSLADDPVEGHDAEELASLVEDLAASYDPDVVVDAGSGAVRTTAAELGLRIDADATVDAVLDETPAAVPFRPFAWIGSFFSERSVSFRFDVDEAALFSAATELELPGISEPREPALEGDADGVRLVPGEPGAGIDPETFAARLLAAADSTRDDELHVDLDLIDVRPVISDDEALTVAADAERATEAGLTLAVGSVQHSLDPATLRSWVEIRIEGPGRVDWGLRPDAVAEALPGLFPEAGSAGVPVGFTVEAGQVRVVPGEPATTCCAEGSSDRIEEALRTGADQVTLDLVPTPQERDEEWAESLGIVEPVASFTTSHSCCQNRVTNIHLIADATRGVVIEPGQTFSLNGHVGRRTAEKGYVPAGGITYGVIVDQLGGGISQFTTTLFNAAFFAGLDFGEYQAHSIYFSRYPYGREATLSFPHPDLEIVNNTPYGVLIWPTYTDTEITVTLYSTPHVEVQQTGQTTSMQGVCTRVTTERTRWYEDGRVDVDTVGALYRRQEGENCQGESSAPPPDQAPPPGG